MFGMALAAMGLGWRRDVEQVRAKRPSVDQLRRARDIEKAAKARAAARKAKA